METNNKKVFYDSCLKYLDITFLNEELKSLLKTNSNFSNLIEKMISIIFYFEDNKIINESNYSRLEIAYKTITSKEDFKVSDFENDNDFEEIIGYFPILISNSINKTIEQIEMSMSQKTQSTNSVIKKDSEKEEDSNSSENGIDLTSSLSSIPFGNIFNSSNITQLADQMVLQASEGVLRSKIATGEVYRFSTKPKVIPILKYIIAALFCLVVLLMVAAFGILAYMNQKPAVTVITDASTNTTASRQLTTVGGFDILSLLIYVLIVGVLTYSLVKNTKNDNLKYRLNWGSISIFLFIAWLSIFMKAIQGSDPVFGWDSLKSALEKNNNTFNATAIKLFEIYRILQFVIYGLLSLITILVILGAVFNPKPDVERLQKLVLKYSEDIRNGNIDFDSSNSNQPGRFSNGWF